VVPTARDEFAALLEYVEGAFGLEAALKLLDRTEEMVTRIAAFPEMYPASRKKKEIRKATVSKQTTLYYRLTTDEIQLLHFYPHGISLHSSTTPKFLFPISR
jgi:plasmid stabilization system protein ParE